MESFLSVITQVWNWSIITVNNNPITVSNVILGSLFMFLALKGAKKFSEFIGGKIFPQLIEDATSRRTVQNFTYYAMIFIFSLFALNLANIPLTAFTFLGGALAIGVGFGSQNLVNNFFSGIILMVERPVKVGDFIEVDGIFGRVQDIGFRSTKLIGFGNRHMIVPNSSFLEKNVLNWTHSDEMVRTGVKVGVAYGSDTELVHKLIKQAVDEEDKILEEPKPLILFRDFADNSLNFEVFFSLDLRILRDMHIVESNVRYRINKLFNDHSVVIAFPQRDLHFDPERPIPIELRNAPPN